MIGERLRLLARALARRGILVVRLRDRYGFDVWSDIRRLANAWHYEIKVVFDVGANVGDTSTSVFQEIPGVEVTAFEANPETFTKLSARLESRPGFTAVNSATSSRAGDVQMFVYDDNKIGSLVENAPYAVRSGLQGRRITVPCTTLDLYCAEKDIAGIDILKVDTEGHDLAVLEGAIGLLEAGAIKFVYVEFNDLQQRGGVTEGALTPIDTLLRQRGFRFIASYVDYVITTGELFSVSNALFALPPNANRVHEHATAIEKQ